MADNSDVKDLPAAVAAPKSRRTVQLVWLIPFVAALVGGWLAVKAVLDKGPVITIKFKTAEGLEAGKTKLKYKDVEVGLVTSVSLAPDLSGVVATAEMGKGASEYLVDDMQFWVVRPRISGGSVSGLSTLLAGSYIGVALGKSPVKAKHFVGLDVPPVFTAEVPGREFILRSEDLGSLDVGAPVYFRRLQVGQVAGYELNKDGKGVVLSIFVNAPYDAYVTTNTRFWHASGIDVALDSTGIKVQTQSMVSIVLGGLAFETPSQGKGAPQAEPKTQFELYANRTEALKYPDAIVEHYLLSFDESLRGLAPGAVVDFRGIPVGEVVAIHSRFDPVKNSIELPVEIKTFPERLGSRQVGKGPKPGRIGSDPRKVLDAFVAQGLRAQLRTGNLLTGQLYIALDFFPNAKKASINWQASPPELPVISGNLEDLKSSLAGVARKLEKIDYEAIGNELRQTLQSTNQLMLRLDREITPEARALLTDTRQAIVSIERTLGGDSPTMQETRATLSELARAAAAFRALADYLERHPEALLSGKKEEKK